MSVAGSRRLLSVVAFMAFSLAAGSVQAQTRSETLRYVTGASVNTLDPNTPGSTREAFAVSLNLRPAGFFRPQTTQRQMGV
jgi:peptide/nickel transport system substrate-binding protein